MRYQESNRYIISNRWPRNPSPNQTIMGRAFTSNSIWGRWLDRQGCALERCGRTMRESRQPSITIATSIVHRLILSGESGRCGPVRKLKRLDLQCASIPTFKLSDLCRLSSTQRKHASQKIKLTIIILRKRSLNTIAQACLTFQLTTKNRKRINQWWALLNHLFRCGSRLRKATRPTSPPRVASQNFNAPTTSSSLVQWWSPSTKRHISKQPFLCRELTHAASRSIPMSLATSLSRLRSKSSN